MALRWGICSAAKASNDFVVGLKSGDNKAKHSVAAIAARSLESAAKFAETHSIPKAYGSYEQLAQDPDVRKHCEIVQYSLCNCLSCIGDENDTAEALSVSACKMRAESRGPSHCMELLVV